GRIAAGRDFANVKGAPERRARCRVPGARPECNIFVPTWHLAPGTWHPGRSPVREHQLLPASDGRAGGSIRHDGPGGAHVDAPRAGDAAAPIESDHTCATCCAATRVLGHNDRLCGADRFTAPAGVPLARG